MALQLRYLQTLGSIASESKQEESFVFVIMTMSTIFLYIFISFSPLDNSTIVFPIPIDLVSSLIPTLGKGVNNDDDDYFYECADILTSFRPQDQA